MLINCEYVNATEGYGIGEDGIHEPFTDDPGELFRFAQREFGRCISSVYVDATGGAKRIGWVFERTERYEDTGEPYKREVWVTLYEKPTTVTRKEHFHILN